VPLGQSNICCIESIMNMLCIQVDSEKEREGSTVVAEDVCVMETEMCTEGTYIPFDEFWMCSSIIGTI